MAAASLPPLAIVVGADENYALPLTVALHSALEKLDPSRPVEVFIIDGGIHPKSLKRIEACLSGVHPLALIAVHSPPIDDIVGFPTNQHISTASYLRLLIPRVVSGDRRRVLYIDSDVLVTEDITPLFETDMRDNIILAVPDKSHAKEFERLQRSFHWVDFARRTTYFNAGVFLIDLDSWKREKITERAMEFLEMFGALCKYHDQCALNLSVLGRWGELDHKWNNQISGMTPVFPEAFNNIHGQGILHFVSKDKPWKGRRRCLGEYQYLQALIETGWLGKIPGFTLIAKYHLHGIKRDLQALLRSNRQDRRKA